MAMSSSPIETLASGWQLASSSLLAGAIEAGNDGIFGANIDAAIATVQAGIGSFGNETSEDAGTLTAVIDQYSTTPDRGARAALRSSMAAIIRNDPKLLEKILPRIDLSSLVHDTRPFQSISGGFLAIPAPAHSNFYAQASSEEGRSNPGKRTSIQLAAPGEAPVSAEAQRAALRLDERRASLQSDYGFDKTLLNALDEETIAILERLTANPTTLFAKGTVSMLKAVHETSRGREKELLRILGSYRGSLFILREFLRNMEMFDPFAAARAAKVEVLPASKLPEGATLVESDANDDATDTPEGYERGTKVRVVGASGHKITGLIYCVFDPRTPSTSVGYFSKRRAIMRILTAFYPEKYEEAKMEEVRTRRHSSTRRVNESITLSDLTENPDLAKELGSLLITRDLALFEELQKAIKDHRDVLANLVYGGRIVMGAIENLKLRSDPGGQTFAWFERTAKEGRGIPEAILSAVRMLQNPHVELTPEQELALTRIVVAYKRVHQYIDKGTALGGAISDIAAFESLADDDLFKKSAKVLAAKQRLQEVAASPEEMTHAQFSEILNLASLAEFRCRMNDRELKRYGDDFAGAMEHFKSVLFNESGAVHEDCYEESVPMTRLKESLYGKHALLGQPEFKHIIQALFLNRVSSGMNFLTAMPVRDFRIMVRSVVVSYRKAKHLDAEIEKLKRARSDLAPVALVSGAWFPGEDFMAAEAREGKKVLSIREFGARLADSNAHMNDRKLVVAAARVSLFSSNHEAGMRLVHDDLARLVPAGGLEGKVNAVERIARSPFVNDPSDHDAGVSKRSYFRQGEVDRIKAIAAFLPRFVELKLDDKQTVAELDERWKTVHTLWFFDGDVSAEGEKNRLAFRHTSGNIPSTRHDGVVVYYLPDEIKEFFRRLDNDYVRLDTLPEAWFEKMRSLCSGEQEALAAQDLKPLPGRYAKRAFVNAVDALSTEKPKTVHTAGERIGNSNHFRWLNTGDGDKLAPFFGFGKHAGRRISDVVNEINATGGKRRLSYFSSFIMNGSFPPHVKSIARWVTDNTKEGEPFPEEKFVEWIESLSF